MSTDVKTVDHARQNAECSYQNICEMVANLEMESAAQWFAEHLTREECIAVLIRHDCENETNVYDVYDASYTDEDLHELICEIITDGATVEGFDFDSEAAQKRIQEDALSVEVRSGWYSPGDKPESPDEFMILLTTGGPALRIIGDLDEYAQPVRARLEYQDWGTPWTEYFDVDKDTLLKYCACFYFGE